MKGCFSHVQFICLFVCFFFRWKFRRHAASVMQSLARFQIIFLTLVLLSSIQSLKLSSGYFGESLRHFYWMIYRTELVSCVPTFSEQNCIPAVGVSQIEREILIALVFSPVEKKNVAKVAAKETLVRSDGSRSGFGPLRISTSKALGNVPFENLVTQRNLATRRRTAMRQGLLRRRLMWWIIFVQKCDIILDKAPM